MVQVAIEQYEPPGGRLMDDDLAVAFLPATQRVIVHVRWSAPHGATLAAGERAAPRSWALIACRKRHIADKLYEALDGVDAVVVLGAGMDTTAYRLARRSGIPAFEVDLPVNIGPKSAAVRHTIGAVPDPVRLVPLDFERRT